MWDHAGFWIRLAAYIIDAIILFVVQMIVNMIIIGSAINTGTEDLATTLLSSGVNILIGLAYFAVLESGFNQGTLGKMALGIKVVNSAGGRISLPLGIGRYLAKIISSIMCFIGFIMAGITQDKQALHDLICNTYVIRR